MVRSVINKAGKLATALSIMALAAFNYSFRAEMDEEQWLSWSNKCLTELYNPPVDPQLKKWELMLTPDHFLRLRKTYQHGKQEYYSLYLNHLDSVNYLGTADNGTLEFKAHKDDIIVQTYEDPKGNIDSMATVLDVPVKSASPQRLDSLNEAIQYLKTKGL